MKVDEIHVEMASREFAEIEIIKTIAAKKMWRWDHRREELLRGNGGRCGRASAIVSEARRGGAIEFRTRLWTKPDSAVGGETEIEEHGGWREGGAQRAGNGMIKPALKDDAFLADVKRRRRMNLSCIVVARAERISDQVWQPLSADRSVSLRFADEKYSGTDKPHVRMTERVVDRRG